MWLQAQCLQLAVLGVVVVLLGLHAGVGHAGHLEGWAGGGGQVCVGGGASHAEEGGRGGVMSLGGGGEGKPDALTLTAPMTTP